MLCLQLPTVIGKGSFDVDTGEKCAPIMLQSRNRGFPLKIKTLLLIIQIRSKESHAAKLFRPATGLHKRLVRFRGYLIFFLENTQKMFAYKFLDTDTFEVIIDKSDYKNG